MQISMVCTNAHRIPQKLVLNGFAGCSGIKNQPNHRLNFCISQVLKFTPEKQNKIRHESIKLLCRRLPEFFAFTNISLIKFLSRIDDLSPVKITPFKSMNESFGGSDVCRHRNIMHITKSEKIHFIRLMGLSCKRIPEKQEKVDFVAGYTRTDLLVSALGAA